ncbi:WD40-repeat-containing domain protein [Syncephalis fuscata]|nr:WD40-repeat-containing domain protein [Syncephalis fuscata]
MKFFTGDEIGLLRSINVRLGAPATPANESDHDDEADSAQQKKRPRKPDLEVNQWGKADRNGAFQQLSWASNLKVDWSSEDKLLLLARKNGKIEYHSSETGEIVKEYQEDNIVQQAGKDRFVGCWSGDNRLVTCTENGCVQYRKLDANSNDNDSLVRALVPGSVAVMRVHPKQHHLFATGGKDQNLTIWDINQLDNGRPKAEQKAKNLPNDFLDLKRPIWITDMAFTSPDDPSCVALTTANHEVQIYDFRQKRRPVINNVIGKHALNVMTLSPNHNELYCADNYSNVHCVDIRTGKLRCSFKGFSGAVTSMACTDKHLVTVALDRHLRIHETKGARKLLKKVYLKQRLSHVVVDDNGEDETEEHDEDDEIWASMETTKKAKKRTKN